MPSFSRPARRNGASRQAVTDTGNVNARPKPDGGVPNFLMSDPFALQPHTVAEVMCSLRDAGVPETEWLQELQGMERDGSLQAFLLVIEQSLVRKLRGKEQEMLAELASVQRQLCGSP